MAQDIWKFDKSFAFYTDLGMRESSGNHVLDVKQKTNKGHIGLYQMSERALVDARYYRKEPPPGQNEPNYNNDWLGIWLGKNGINSKSDFLSSKAVQDIAVREYHKIIWEEKGYLGRYQKYEGTVINGIILTKAGMIAASHLVGAGEVQKFIKTGGTKEVARDGLDTTLTEYLAGFADPRYQVDYSIEGMMSSFMLREMAMRAQQSSMEEKLDSLRFAEDLAEQEKEMAQSPEYEEYRRAAQDIVDLNTKILESGEAEDLANLCKRMEEEAAAYAGTAEGHETLRWAEQLQLDSQKAMQYFAADPENQDFLRALGVYTDIPASSDK